MLATMLSKEPSSTNALEHSLKLEKEILEERKKGEKAITDRYQLDLLPHRVYGVGVTNDGVSWVAKAELADGVSIVGRGSCPSKAIKDFDEQWMGLK